MKFLSRMNELQEVVIATAVTSQTNNQSILYRFTQNDLKWGNCMKELSEANVDEVMNGYDSLTSL